MSADDSVGGFTGDDFGQKIDLTVRIREILRNYPEGTSIFKELIQNADDAKAKSVSFCVDHRTFHALGENDKNVKVYGRVQELNESPSLLVHNDAVFTKEDFASIQSIGNSMKQKDRSKRRTGRFGIGFNSVYHLTDVPSFVSERYIVMFDPHAKYLPDPNPNNPGKLIDFMKHKKVLRTYPSVFVPLQVFGCSFAKPYKGTIFRFPLRTEAQAKASKLSSAHHSAAKVLQMLQEFQQEAHTALLFLKHVEHIVFFSWDNTPEQQAPRRYFRASIVNSSAETRRKRSLKWSATDTSWKNSAERRDAMLCDFNLEILTEHTPSHGSATRVVRKFAVCNNFGGEAESHFLSQESAQSLGLTPWGGCAALLSTDNTAESPVSSPNPTASCTLPLPIITGLPVQVNAFFELSSNRRDIWHGNDLAGSGAVRCAWNEMLLAETITNAYIRLLTQLRNRLCKGSDDSLSIREYYRLFPTSTRCQGPPWNFVVKSFYSKLMRNRTPLFAIQRSADPRLHKWIDINSAIFARLENTSEVDIANIFSGTNNSGFRAPVCVVPTDIVATILDCDSRKNHTRILTPSCARGILRAVADFAYPKCIAMQVEHFRTVSSYCLSDITEETFADIVGVPLLPVKAEVRPNLKPTQSELSENNVSQVPLLQVTACIASKKPRSNLWTASERHFACTLRNLGYTSWSFLADMVELCGPILAQKQPNSLEVAIDRAVQQSSRSTLQLASQKPTESSRYMPKSVDLPTYAEKLRMPSVHFDGGAVLTDAPQQRSGSLHDVVGGALQNIFLDHTAFSATSLNKLLTLHREQDPSSSIFVAANLQELLPTTTSNILSCVYGTHDDLDEHNQTTKNLHNLWTYLGSTQFPPRMLQFLPIIPVISNRGASDASLSCTTPALSLDASIVVQMNDLPPALNGVLQKLGLYSLNDSCLDDEDHQRRPNLTRYWAEFAHASTPLGALRAVMNLHQRRGKAIFSAISDTEKGLLFEVMCQAFALAKQQPNLHADSFRAVFVSGSPCLKEMEIFPFSTPNTTERRYRAMESKSCRVLFCATLSHPGTVSTNFLVPEHSIREHDLELLSTVLDVRIVTFPEACIEGIFKCIADLSTEFAVAAAKAILDSIGSGQRDWNGRQDLLKIVERTAFIPVHDGARDADVNCTLANAADLYERHDSPLFTNNVGESFRLEDILPANLFPHTDLSSSVTHRAALRMLGIRTTLKRQDVLHAARHTNDAVQASKLLAYLDSHFDQYFVDSSSAKISRGIARGFAKLFGGTRARDGDSRGDSGSKKGNSISANKFCAELRSIAWMPAIDCRSPSAEWNCLFPWESTSESAEQTTAVLRPPEQVRLSKDAWLCSFSFALLTAPTPPSQAICGALGLLRPLPAHTVVNQLVRLAATVNETIATRELSMLEKQLLARHISSIYFTLNRMISDPKTSDISSAVAVLKHGAWIWCGSRFVTSSCVSKNFPFDIPPYLFRLPPEVQHFEVLHSAAGVVSSFSPKKLLHTLNDIAMSAATPHGDQRGLQVACLSNEILPRVVSVLAMLASLDCDVKNVASTINIDVFCPDSAGVLRPVSALVYNDMPWVNGDQSPDGRGGSPEQDRRLLADNLSVSLASADQPELRHFQVHSQIAHDVAQKIGVASLRSLVLAGHLNNLSSDPLSENVDCKIESFGQSEPLTSRISKILEAYPDGTQIFHELMQNADDAGATRVRIVLDTTSYGTRSLFSKDMKEFQGPAILFYNDAEFKTQDFKNLASIGQGAKLHEISKTGRFGLGFNSVYHFTDVPSFVSGDHIVFLDPHATHIPYATTSQPGVKINFGGEFNGAVASQFRDQFLPYEQLLRGDRPIDSLSDFNKPAPERRSSDDARKMHGTLFRFPLRQRTSEISTRTANVDGVLEVLKKFQHNVQESLLFLRNVRSLEVFIHEGNEERSHHHSSSGPVARKTLLFAASCAPTHKRSRKWRCIDEYISKVAPNQGHHLDAPCVRCKQNDCRCFYDHLIQQQPKKLPGSVVESTYSVFTPTTVVHQHHERAEIADRNSPPGMKCERHTYVIASYLGAGVARTMACDPANFHLRLMPRASVAFRVAHSCVDDGPSAPVPKFVGSEEYLQQNLRAITSTEGQVFVTLPAPILTGLPCHVNAPFELTSNRRALWAGLHGELAGDGAIRSQWNEALLEDVVAPTYAWLILKLKQTIGWCDLFLQSWPRQQLLQGNIWVAMAKNLYARLSSKRLVMADDNRSRDGASVGTWQIVRDALVLPSNVCPEYFAALAASHGSLKGCPWHFESSAATTAWLRTFLNGLGLVVDLPSDLRESLLLANVVFPATPDVVRSRLAGIYEHIRNVSGDRNNISTQIAKITEYCLIDFPQLLGADSSKFAPDILAAFRGTEARFPVVLGQSYSLTPDGVSDESATGLQLLNNQFRSTRCSITQLLARTAGIASADGARITAAETSNIVAYHLMGPLTASWLHGLAGHQMNIETVGETQVNRFISSVVNMVLTDQRQTSAALLLMKEIWSFIFQVLSPTGNVPVSERHTKLCLKIFDQLNILPTVPIETLSDGPRDITELTRFATFAAQTPHALSMYGSDVNVPERVVSALQKLNCERLHHKWLQDAIHVGLQQEETLATTQVSQFQNAMEFFGQQRYWQPLSFCGFISYFHSISSGNASSIDSQFNGMSDDDKNCLFLYLLDSSGGASTLQEQEATFAATLPIFPTVAGPGGSIPRETDHDGDSVRTECAHPDAALRCASLSGSCSWLCPANVSIEFIALVAATYQQGLPATTSNADRPKVQWLHPCVDKHQNLLIELLGVQQMSESVFWQDFALPAVQWMSVDDGDKIVSHLLKKFPETVKRNRTLLSAMKQTPLLMTRSYTQEAVRRCPSELLDPSSKSAIVSDSNAVNWISPNCFPHEKYCTESHLKVLRKLGLQSHISMSIVIRSASDIESCATESIVDTSEVANKSRALLHYCIQSGICARATKDEIESLRDLKWVAVGSNTTRRPTLPWLAFDDTVALATESDSDVQLQIKWMLLYRPIVTRCTCKASTGSHTQFCNLNRGRLCQWCESLAPTAPSSTCVTNTLVETAQQLSGSDVDRGEATEETVTVEGDSICHGIHFVSPGQVRFATQEWWCSASYFVCDAALLNDLLKLSKSSQVTKKVFEIFGWDCSVEPPTNISSVDVHRQLCAIAFRLSAITQSTLAAQSGPQHTFFKLNPGIAIPTVDTNTLNGFVARQLQSIVVPMYKYLESALESVCAAEPTATPLSAESLLRNSEVRSLDANLQSEPWIWCGPTYGFRSPHCVAVHCDLNLAPHLCSIAAPLGACQRLLSLLRIPERFSLQQLVERLNALPRNGPLWDHQFDFAIKILKQIAKEADSDGEIPQLGIRQLPSQDRVMLPLQSLFANDAQWIIDGSANGPRQTLSAGTSIIHSKVPAMFAAALGVSSARERILKRTKTARQLVCPSVQAVTSYNSRRYNSKGAADEACHGFVINDLLQAFDSGALAAQRVHAHLDERRFPSERLVHTSLADFQGPALCLQVTTSLSGQAALDAVLKMLQLRARDETGSSLLLNNKSLFPGFELADCIQILCGSHLAFINPLTKSARLFNFVECAVGFDDQYAPFEAALHGFNSTCNTEAKVRSPFQSKRPLTGCVLFRLPLRSYPSKLSPRHFPLNVEPSENILPQSSAILFHFLQASQTCLTFTQHCEAFSVSCVGHNQTPGSSGDAALRLCGSIVLQNAADVREPRVKVCNSKKWRQSSWLFWKKNGPVTNSYRLRVSLRGLVATFARAYKTFKRNDGHPRNSASSCSCTRCELRSSGSLLLRHEIEDQQPYNTELQHSTGQVNRVDTTTLESLKGSIEQVWLVFNYMAPPRLKDLIFTATFKNLREQHELTPFVGASLLLSSVGDSVSDLDPSEALTVDGHAFVNGCIASSIGLPVHVHGQFLLDPSSRNVILPPPSEASLASQGVEGGALDTLLQNALRPGTGTSPRDGPYSVAHAVWNACILRCLLDNVYFPLISSAVRYYSSLPSDNKHRLTQFYSYLPNSIERPMTGLKEIAAASTLTNQLRTAAIFLCKMPTPPDTPHAAPARFKFCKIDDGYQCTPDGSENSLLIWKFMSKFVPMLVTPEWVVASLEGTPDAPKIDSSSGLVGVLNGPLKPEHVRQFLRRALTSSQNTSGSRSPSHRTSPAVQNLVSALHSDGPALPAAVMDFCLHKPSDVDELRHLPLLTLPSGRHVVLRGEHDILLLENNDQTQLVSASGYEMYLASSQTDMLTSLRNIDGRDKRLLPFMRIRRFSAESFAAILPKIMPSKWKGMLSVHVNRIQVESAAQTAQSEHSRRLFQPTFPWIQLLWKTVSLFRAATIAGYRDWPLIPVESQRHVAMAHDESTERLPFTLVRCDAFPRKVIWFLNSSSPLFLAAGVGPQQRKDLLHILAHSLSIPQLHRGLFLVNASQQVDASIRGGGGGGGGGAKTSTVSAGLLPDATALHKAILQLIAHAPQENLKRLEIPSMCLLRELLRPGIANNSDASQQFSVTETRQLAHIPMFATVNGSHVAVLPNRACIALPEDDGTGNSTNGGIATLPTVFTKYGCADSHQDPRVCRISALLLPPEDPFTSRFAELGFVQIVPASNLLYKLMKEGPYAKLSEEARTTCVEDLVRGWRRGLREDALLRSFLGQKQPIFETSKGRFVRARDLLDHRNDMLRTVFDDDSLFAPRYLQELGDSAYQFLTDLGLRTTVDATLCLKCAQTIARWATNGPGNFGVVKEFSHVQRARVFLRYLWDNLEVYFNRDFFSKLSQVRCVPVEVSSEFMTSIGMRESLQASSLQTVSSSDTEQFLQTRFGCSFVFARFKDCAAPSTFPLIWTVLPVLRDLDYPPPAVALQLGVISEPRPDDVISHIQNLTSANCLSPAYQWPDGTSCVDVFNALFSYFAARLNSVDRSKTLSQSTVSQLRAMPLVPIAGQFIQASKLFLRCNAAFMPILWEIPRHFGSHESFFKALGCRQNPSTVELVQAMVNLERSKRCGHNTVEVLNVNELTAAASILGAIASTRGQQSDEGEDALHLVVPDTEGLLAPLSKVVYSDDSTLAELVDTRSIRIANPLLSWDICRPLGMCRLSEIVDRRVDDVCVQQLDSSSAADSANMRPPALLRLSESLTRKVASPEFGVALQRLLRFEAVRKHKAGESRTLRTDFTDVADMMAGYSFRCVESLHSRMFVGAKDITLSSTRQHRELFLVDKSHKVVYLSCSLDGVNSKEDMVVDEIKIVANIAALAVQSILPQILHVLALSAMLACEPAAMAAVLSQFNIRDDHSKTFSKDAARGKLGGQLHELDIQSMQLQPGRVYLHQELVAYEDAAVNSNAKPSHRYGRVLSQNFDTDLGLGLSVIDVQTDSAGAHREMLSSEVWCFQTTGTRTVKTDGSASKPSLSVFRKNRSSASARKSSAGSKHDSHDVHSTSAPSNGTSKSQQPPSARMNTLVAVQTLLSKVGIALDGEKLTLLEQQLSLSNEVAAKDRDLSLLHKALQSAQDDNKKLRQSFQCSICMENEVDRILVPCGHLICKECVHQLRSRTCPFDRKPISQVAPFFKPF